MLGNHFRIAFRKLLGSKLFSLSNLMGLSIGIACTLFILLWVKDERSYDKIHENYDNTWEVLANRNFNGVINTDYAICLPMADAMKQSLPQVKNATFSSFEEGHVLQLGEKLIRQNGFRVGNGYLEMFTWKFIHGHAATALNSPGSIVLTKSTAEAFFGSADPMDKILRLDNQFDVKVTGVIADLPGSSTIQFNFLLPFEANPEQMQDWVNAYTQVFVQTQPGTDANAFAKDLNALVKRHSDNAISDYFIHPMSKWRLYSDFRDGKNVGGMIEYVRLFSIIAVVILLIACINFMNLSTARSEKRAKEVGIRKTLGSGKFQLMVQFFMESIILSAIAFVVACALVYLLLPAFNGLVNKSLHLDFSSAEFWWTGLGIVLLTGLLAGSYPALYLSSFNPVKVLKGSFLPGKSAVLPRRILVIGQFSISILLISATLIVYKQLQHVKSRDLGYDPSNLVSIPLSPEANRNFSVIKQELIQSGLVSNVTRTSAPLTDIWNFTPAPDYEGKPAGGNMIFAAIRVTDDFTKTAGMELIDGREFSNTGADSASLMLNEAAVKTMGLKNAVGTRMRMNNREVTVVGVTKDVVMGSPYRPVEPMMMLYRQGNLGFASVRLTKTNNPQAAIALLGSVFKKYNPAFPFEYEFTDQAFNRKFITEELIGKLTNIFAGLALFICCLGLSGLAAFTIQKRIREIGIRKVLGASVQQVLFMVSREFLVMVGISLLIAVPLTWWWMNDWLQQFAYRIDIGFFQFFLAGAGVLLLTLVTVCLNALGAARRNPVKTLRAE